MKNNSSIDFNYINRVMKYHPDYTDKKLICITNGKEVLRITRKQAKNYFFKTILADKKILKVKQRLGFEVSFKDGCYYERTKGWYYTTKQVYEQYIESLKPGSKIPAPKFQITVMNKKGEDKIISTHIFQQFNFR